MKYISKKLFLLPTASLLIAAFAYTQLPEQIPIHFNAAGQPDNYAGKLFVFMEPLLAYALLVLAEFFPKIDPKKASYERFPKAYQLIQVLVQILLLGTNVFTIMFALGYQLNMTFLLSAAVGLMFVVLGNYMPKFKQTFFCGIRTPWALSDEENWNMTHRFGGKLWMVGGVIVACCAFLPADYTIYVLLAVIAVMVIVPYVYSYLLFRKKEAKK